MNFYKHHIGDYATATSHLSFIEDGAYSRLIRRYYSTEAPLPEDPQAVARLVGAKSKAESAAVTAMLQEFFVLEGDGWHQKRCDEEIAAAQGKAERNREVGKLGGRPHKTETQVVSKQKPNGNPNGFHSEPNDNPLQNPDSNIQTPSRNIPTQTLPAERAGPVLENGPSNPRALGTNPRAKGTNPRSLGTNPRADRDEHRKERDAALEVFNQLVASGGANPPRDHKLQAAIDAVGGWSRIAQREQGLDAQRVQRDFVEAYRSVS